MIVTMSYEATRINIVYGSTRIVLNNSPPNVQGFITSAGLSKPIDTSVAIQLLESVQVIIGNIAYEQ